MNEAAKRDDFARSFDSEFARVAVYFPSMDYLDYVRSDGLHVSERIDRFLTLVWDEAGDELVGFKLKGLKHFFLTQLKPALQLADDDFIAVRDLFVALATKFGDELFADDGDRVRIAYRRAMKIAANDNVQLSMPSAEMLEAA